MIKPEPESNKSEAVTPAGSGVVLGDRHMQLRHEEIQRRYAEFPDPVRVLGYEIVRVKQIMDAYAHGGIITMQEALCRMVVELATDTESQRKQMIHMMERSTFIMPEMPAVKVA
jgi:hypothetical protein